MKLLSVLMVLLLAAGCASTQVKSPTQITEKVAKVQTCTSPVAKLAIAKISCKAKSCKDPSTNTMAFLRHIATLAGQGSFDAGIGEGISDMFLSALKQTNCFEIMERESMAEIKQEIELMGKDVKIEPADILISGSITSLSIESKNANLGLNIVPVLSSVDVKDTKATIGLDIRVIDVSTAKVTYNKTYEANNENRSYGFGSSGNWTGIGFGGSYSHLKGSALEEVVRDIVIRATVDIVNAKDSLMLNKIKLSQKTN